MTDTERPLGVAVHLAHDQIGDELLILDMHSGNYYNVNATGAQLWEALRHTPTPTQLVEFAQHSFTGDAVEIAEAVTAWLDEMQREKLVVPWPDAPATPLQPLTPALTFTMPQTEKFTDLQDFMLLDPIHEVDPDQGWPHLQNK
jgi:hypothetical protein